MEIHQGVSSILGVSAAHPWVWQSLRSPIPRFDRRLVIFRMVAGLALLFAPLSALGQGSPLQSTTSRNINTFTNSSTLTAEPTSNFSLGNLRMTYQGNSAGNGSAVSGFETSITLTGSVVDSLYLLSSYVIDKALCPASGPCGGAVAIQGSSQRYVPGQGVPLGGQLVPVWGLWAPQTDYTDLPTSIAGPMLNEFDIATNNLDDATGRGMLSGVLSQHNLRNHATEAQGISLTSEEPDTAWFETGFTLNGAYNLAGMDFRGATTKRASITSPTPHHDVDRVTVDNVLPFARGGDRYSSSGQWLGSVSTKATLGIRSAADSRESPRIAVTAACGEDNTCIRVGEYVTDISTVSAIPPRTRVLSGSGSQWTISANATVRAGDELIFAPGAKKIVLFDGKQGTVVGIALAGPGSPAGTVYLNGPITPAEAANSVSITPVAPTLWMSAGNGTNVPPDSISFDDAASATLACNTDPCTGIVAGLPVIAPGLTVTDKAISVPVVTGLTATGNTQRTALVLSANVNVVATVAPGSGVMLPSEVGKEIEILNRGRRTLLVYPPAGASIDGGAANAAISELAYGKLRIVCATKTDCYSE